MTPDSTVTRPAARPVPVGTNTPATFYRGSGRIDAFRGSPAGGTDRPEDWVASTVTRLGEPAAGLTLLESGVTLRDEIRADPMRWLGHDAAGSPELEIPLVKLLDAGQRLPVHVHPDDAWAQARGIWPNGKAEAWFVIEAPGPASCTSAGRATSLRRSWPDGSTSRTSRRCSRRCTS